MGRGDAKAGKGGHKTFGKSGGGNGSISSKLIASPMSPKMAPPKTTSFAGKK